MSDELYSAGDAVIVSRSVGRSNLWSKWMDWSFNLGRSPR